MKAAFFSGLLLSLRLLAGTPPVGHTDSPTGGVPAHAVDPVPALIRDLDSDDYGARAHASAELERLLTRPTDNPRVVRALRAALPGAASAEQRRRLQTLILSAKVDWATVMHNAQILAESSPLVRRTADAAQTLARALRNDPELIAFEQRTQAMLQDAQRRAAEDPRRAMAIKDDVLDQIERLQPAIAARSRRVLAAAGARYEGEPAGAPTTMAGVVTFQGNPYALTGGAGSIQLQPQTRAGGGGPADTHAEVSLSTLLSASQLAAIGAESPESRMLRFEVRGISTTYQREEGPATGRWFGTFGALVTRQLATAYRSHAQAIQQAAPKPAEDGQSADSFTVR